MCVFVSMCVVSMSFISRPLHAYTQTPLQDSPHIAELITVVSLIRNLLYRSFDSKVVVMHDISGIWFKVLFACNDTGSCSV